MVTYPEGGCPVCGEREYYTITGEGWCPNCDRQQAPADDQNDDQDMIVPIGDS